MEILAAIPHYGFWFLLLLTVLVFVHEMGHFLVARWCGVRVEVFSIGFGPELFGFTDRLGTRWKFSAIPLGGYVRMFGQESNALEGQAAAPMSEEDAAVAFNRKSVGQRAAIVAAGPLANYVFAIVVLTGLFLVYGKTLQSTEIGEVMPDSVASEAGLKAGDKIATLNGSPLEGFEDLAMQVRLHLDEPLQLGIDRAGQKLDFTLKPRIVEEEDTFGNKQRVGRLGIRSSGNGNVRKLGVGQSVVEATHQVYQMTTGMLTGIGQMITGKRSADEVGGALRIAKMSGDMAEIGFASLVSLAVLLSVNLGLINLFPIPMLDGGHLMFYAAEALRGRPLGARAHEWGLRLGVAFVLSLMVFATWNDLVYLKVVDYIKSLFT
ncbi:RIP metalloprotease RseP [Dongia soli]|uniref:Zinc metalloprotease n=1 Tax=Dongia soli TaxID=600628 RepID=A0ABU5E9L3_9PROT|nr:RIP metalloprotease RseP [Dongia soli]MDY0883036.1 RIP metalloprotease RseP [Dongia soli]